MIQRVKTNEQQFRTGLTFLSNKRDAKGEEVLFEICNECQMGTRLRKNREKEMEIYALITLTGKNSRNTNSLGGIYKLYVTYIKIFPFIYIYIFFKEIHVLLFIYLFIYDCVESSFLREGFL